MPSALQRPHVLIVSDDPDLSAFLGEGLIYAGFWTSVIASALQALEVFRLRTFDALLLDASLGGIGAVEFLRRLRGRSDRSLSVARSDIPVLVAAALPEELDPRFAKIPGDNQLVLAPIELEDLGQRISKAVSTWRESHPDRLWADDAALGSS